MIQVARPYFRYRQEILSAIDKILESGRLMNGESGRQFEREFADLCGTRFAISVNSCTTALEITLRWIDVQGAEVIIPANTFIATGNAVRFAGGMPVIADIRDGTYAVDLESVRSRVTERTKAVIAVHIAGIIQDDIGSLRDFCTDRGISLIEDCAHAVGAGLAGKKGGNFGTAGCFSFYPTKIITTGSGGMITTDSAELDTYARSVRVHGSSSKGTSEIIQTGNDWYLDEIRAAVGLYQLRDLPNLLGTRRRIAGMYRELLSPLHGITIFPLPPQSEPSYYKFPVQLAECLDPEAVKSTIEKEFQFDLESLYWPPCHLQPLYRGIYGYMPGDFPTAERILRHQICLPIHPLVTDDDVVYVVRALRSSL